MKSPTKNIKILIVVGSLLIVVCAVFAGCFGLIFSSILNKALVIDDDKEIFKEFTSPSTPINLDVFLFNVTNPEEIQRYGAKPILQEMGPYSYSETYTKYDFYFDDDAGTVAYYQNTSYVFNPQRSNGSESDVVTTLNAVMVIIGSRIQRLNPALQAMGELLFMRFNLRDNLFVTKNVSELLFKGYYDPFVKYLGRITGDPKQSSGKFGFYSHLSGAMLFDNLIFKEIIWPEFEKGMDLFETFTVSELLFEGWELPTLNFDFSDIGINKTEGLNGTIYELLEMLGITVPFLEPNRIGLLYGSNNTNDGRYEVNTGAKDMNTYLYIQKWENDSSLAFWDDQYCDMINGTDGTQFPPDVKKDQIIRLFTTDLCRSLYFEYETELDIYDLIPTYRYVVPPEVLESPLTNPDNVCFCDLLPGDETCLGSSMMNLQICLGAPIVLSTPHFFDGDGAELAKFEGLNPDKEKHETFLDIEPRTGVVMNAAKRIQLNLPLRRYGNLPTFQNVPEVIFPVLWASENAVILEEDANDFSKAVTKPFIIVYSICGVLIVIGLILVTVGFFKYRSIKDEPKFDPLKKKNSTSSH